MENVRTTNVFVLMDISEKIAHYTNARIIALNKALVIVKQENAHATKDSMEKTVL